MPDDRATRSLPRIPSVKIERDEMRMQNLRSISAREFDESRRSAPQFAWEEFHAHRRGIDLREPILCPGFTREHEHGIEPEAALGDVRDRELSPNEVAGIARSVLTHEHQRTGRRRTSAGRREGGTCSDVRHVHTPY